MRRRRVSRWSAAGIAAALSGALILTGLPAVADETPTPEPTTPITVQNTVPDAGTPDAAVPDETPGADVAPEDEAVAPEDADGDVADGLAGRDGGEATENLTDTLDNAVSPLAAAGTAPVCQAGYVYSVSGTGVVRQVNATTSPTSVTHFDGNAWDTVSDSSSINGLAISANGAYMYAYERSGGTVVFPNAARILRYTAATGLWEQLPPSTGITTGNNQSLVAGAVDLSNGKYLFGGFHAVERGSLWSSYYEYQFRIYQFDPATQLSTYKGYIWTGQTARSAGNLPAANGDMAFDAAGNLYIVRSSDNSTSIYSVTAANLAAASNGSFIASQKAADSSTTGILASVNGIAFDATGHVYLGNTTTVRKYDPTTWAQVGGNVTDGLSNSTDLASCNSPANLTVKKNVVARAADGDQFTLAVRSGTATAATATTTGTATGIQPDQVGPIPVIAGNTYTIAETASGTTNLATYASTYVCTVAGNSTPIASGASTTGAVTIPVSSGAGAAVECVFTNMPLTASVTITKQVQDSQGQNLSVAQGWTVNAAVAATTGTVTRTPNAPQETNASGWATWGLQFGTAASRTTVNVSETQRPGFQFVSATCTVTKLDGTTTTSTPPNEAAFALTGVAPGDKVACTYVNKVRPATVTIGKQLQDFTGANAQPAGGWTVGATLVSPASGVTITMPATAQTQRVTGQVSTPWTVDYPVPAAGQSLASATVNVQETMQTGYAFVSGTCTITSASGASRSQELLSATAQLTGLAPGDAAVCTFTNKPIPGTVTWEKVDAAGNHLGGSEWTLSGRDLSSTTVVDCTSASCDPGPYRDQDPAPGVFRIVGLAWGDYTLVESSAPAGFVRDDTPHNFTISAGARDYVFASAFVNIPREGPPLPLTGGQSATMYTLLGGGLLGLASVWAVLRRRRNIRGAA